jgi:hypothetical protein
MHKSKLSKPVLVILTLVFMSQGFSFASAQPRVVYGAVYSAGTGQPLVATVTVTGCGYAQTVSTSSDGSWRMTLTSGISSRITFSAGGYESQSFELGLNAKWFDAGGVVSLRPST